MQSTLIPWQVFLDVLTKQKPSVRESWLRRWFFTDEGVIIAPPGTFAQPARARMIALAAVR